MATFIPVSHRMEIVNRLASALGVPKGTERFVIEVDVHGPVKVYCKSFVEYDKFESFVGVIEQIQAESVTVESDTSISVEVKT